MKKLKHSKYKNTGLIFELLSRKLVQETLANADLKALRLITKHFTAQKPLAQELKLYTALTEDTIGPKLVEKLVETVEKVYSKFDHKLLEIARYNLVRDLKNAYGLDEFFSTRTENYTKYAAVYKFLTYKPEDNAVQYVQNKEALLEMITNDVANASNSSLRKFQAEDPKVRKIGFNIAVEHFNTKYKDLLPEQKELLKQYIIKDGSNENFKQHVFELAESLISDLSAKVPLIEDTALRIKVHESIPLIKSIQEAPILKEDQLNAILKLCELRNRLTKILS